MNRISKLRAGISTNIWTDRGRAARKENKDSKYIPVVSQYTNKNGKVHTYTNWRHATAKDITFSTKPEIEKLTKEQYRTLYKNQKVEKKVRQDSLPYSELHNKLVANLYIIPNRLKQQALEAKHEVDIEKMKNQLQQYKLRKRAEYEQKANNIVEIIKKDNKGVDYVFMTLYSNKKIVDLVATAIEMTNSITEETGTMTTADIYSRSTYPLKYHVEPTTKLAA